MTKTHTSIFMTSKSSKITPIDNVAYGVPSKAMAKTSISGLTQHPWLTVVLGLIAVAGIVGTVSIAVMSFVVLHSTTITTTSKLNIHSEYTV